MFVAPGARERLLASARKEFLEERWPDIAVHIRRLGLDAEDLVERALAKAQERGRSPSTKRRASAKSDALKGLRSTGASPAAAVRASVSEKAGDEQNPLIGPHPPGRFGHLGAVHPRHGEIEHDQIELFLLQD
jgi:hypothetical protein